MQDITLSGVRPSLAFKATTRQIVKNVAHIVLYPWLFWSLIGWVTEFIRLKLRLFGPFAKRSFVVLQFFLFLLIGLPASIVITGELLIHGNELIVGDVHSSSIKDNGQYWWHTGDTLPIPGEPAPQPAPADPKDRKAFYRYLVELHAPVLIQRLGYRPDWDMPVSILLDGNEDPRDNRANGAHIRPLKPVVYGEVTAETKDSYYLTYSMYHLRDYDHPIREQLTGWSYHDGDNEGFMIRIDKKTMRVMQGEGWFHNRFYLANRGEDSQGNEPSQGRIYFENGTHPVIYVQTFGHGVRFAQRYDLAAIEDNAKVFRFRGNRAPKNPTINREVEFDLKYDIEPFDFWYKYARGPIDNRKGVFQREITIAKNVKGQKLSVGRYVATDDSGRKSSWVRPKPPWSWDDGWDNVPIAVWHFFPSIAFGKHFGVSLSDHYIHNEPISKIFNMDANEIRKHLTVKGARRGGSKWGGSLRMKHKYGRKSYVRVFKMNFKRYVNRIFSALG